MSSSVSLVQKKENNCRIGGEDADVRKAACEEAVDECIDEYADGEQSVTRELWKGDLQRCFRRARVMARDMDTAGKKAKPAKKAEQEPKPQEKKSAVRTKSVSTSSGKAGFVCEDGKFFPLSDVSKMPKSCFDASVEALVGAPAKQGSKKADVKREAEKKAEPKVVDMTGEKFKGYWPASGCADKMKSQGLSKNAAALDARKAMVREACGGRDGKIEGKKGANEIKDQGVEVCNEGGIRYWVEISGGKVTCPVE